jgi:hypothetical protein
MPYTKATKKSEILNLKNFVRHPVLVPPLTARLAFLFTKAAE